jgi:hypothetical protein
MNPIYQITSDHSHDSVGQEPTIAMGTDDPAASFGFVIAVKAGGADSMPERQEGRQTFRFLIGRSGRRRRSTSCGGGFFPLTVLPLHPCVNVDGWDVSI